MSSNFSGGRHCRLLQGRARARHGKASVLSRTALSCLVEHPVGPEFYFRQGTAPDEVEWRRFSTCREEMRRCSRIIQSCGIAVRHHGVGHREDILRSGFDYQRSVTLLQLYQKRQHRGSVRLTYQQAYPTQ